MRKGMPPALLLSLLEDSSRLRRGPTVPQSTAARPGHASRAFSGQPHGSFLQALRRNTAEWLGINEEPRAPACRVWRLLVQPRLRAALAPRCLPHLPLLEQPAVGGVRLRRAAGARAGGGFVGA